jgi:hypothetical protein
LPAIWTLLSPAPAPRPDLISLVTVLVMRKVASIARNIHIMGRKVGPPPPIEIVTPLASDETEEAASTPTTSSCFCRLVHGVYAAGGSGSPGPRPVIAAFRYSARRSWVLGGPAT